MSQWRKTLDRVLSDVSVQSIRFDDLCGVLERLGFELSRRGGSHRIFRRAGLVDIVNIQPRPDGTAKPYQVRQVRRLILRYGLHLTVE